MAESVDGRKVFSLLEVATSIQRTLAQRYTSAFWVKAEMNKLNYYPQSGHCYPDLVEKADGKVIAQIRSTLWKDDYQRIDATFRSVVKSPLKDGIKILCCARIAFDPVYGLTLRITDIDPVFALGELEREKQESIAQLREEGIFARNKSLPFPLLPQRLAVISVETSKGYADFNKMIDTNPWGYKFFHILFPSLLQGDRAVESIRHQLARIRRVAQHFDVVAIIRGGGGEIGLSCFNDVRLAREIALFPLPVITGIGHATNETVVEMVSYKNAITPTELAGFLLQKFHDFAQPVKAAEEKLVEYAGNIVAGERQRFFHTMRYFRSLTTHLLARSRQEIQLQARDLFKEANLAFLRGKEMQGSLVFKLKSAAHFACSNRAQFVDHTASGLKKATTAFVRHQRTGIASIEKTIANMHPDNVLRRGYSITRVNGRAVTNSDQVRQADVLETILRDGTVISTVNAVTKSSSHES